ncbi:conserved hypothetical protein [Renibacterium salmoninarum ATCC 33209]|uniref:HutD family protein n=1 Tax=Renibacterium salmoninarum (strain ATCC 33209 / DSM 20767 / JCM 11484 / NBRC 15589 / NCIMB 2235) TaxID=288705 RepID=A9WQR1_RENSM|nr:HutD family protein [Renibacterium salmoninarum]ABY23618.1 conserved hypothetical protein [Renibacterium salmoninarum ATCC 33209]
MRIIRYADLKSQQWLNGGGATRVLDADVPGADFGWRISIASVDKAGPFSALPGVDRVITLIDGEFLLLNVDGAEHGLEKHRPFRFSGDSLVSSEPVGVSMDLNVMTRRGAFQGFTTVLELSKKRPHPVFPGQWAVLLQGDATVSSTGDDGEAPVTLGRYDAVVGQGEADGTGTPELSGRGFVAIISIDAD